MSWAEDGELRVWDLDDGTCRAVFQGHEQHIFGAIQLDERFVASWDGGEPDCPAVLRVWDLKKLKCHRVLKGYEDGLEVQAVCCTSSHFWVYFAHGDVVAWPRKKKKKGRIKPIRWLPGEVKDQHPEVWRQLEVADPETLAGEHGTVTAPSGTVQLALKSGAEVYWCSDGQWTLHDQHADGLIVASCWNRLALLQLHLGQHRMAPAEAMTAP